MRNSMHNYIHKLTNMSRGMPARRNVLRMRFSQNNRLRIDQVLGVRTKLTTTQNIYRISGYEKIYSCGVVFSVLNISRQLCRIRTFLQWR